MRGSNTSNWILIGLTTVGVIGAATVIYYQSSHSREDESGDDSTTTAASATTTTSATEANEESAEEEEDDEEKAEATQGSNNISDQQAVVEAGNLFFFTFGAFLFITVIAMGSLLSLLEDQDNFFRPWEVYPLWSHLLIFATGIMVASTNHIQNIPIFRNATKQIENQVWNSPRNNASESNRREDDGNSKNTSSDRKLPPAATTCSSSEFITKAEELYKQNLHSEIRTCLKQAVEGSFPNDAELLWRLARACNDMVLQASSMSLERKKALAFEGLAFAERAKAVAPALAAGYKWVAIMTSTTGNFQSTKVKISGAYKVRDNITRAIELDPNDATCRNILGQWCVALASLSWVERKAAAAIFGSPPTATFEEALEQFLAAENISPGFWKKNTVLIAQTYYNLKQFESATAWLEKAREIPTLNLDDEEAAADIEALSKKL